jgi:cell division protein FtsB
MSTGANEDQGPPPPTTRHFKSRWRRMRNSVVLLASASIIAVSSTFAATESREAEQRTEQVEMTVRRTNNEISQLKASVALLQDRVEQDSPHTHIEPCVCMDMSIRPPQRVMLALPGNCNQQMLNDLRKLIRPHVVCREP